MGARRHAEHVAGRVYDPSLVRPVTTRVRLQRRRALRSPATHGEPRPGAAPHACDAVGDGSAAHPVYGSHETRPAMIAPSPSK